MKNSDLLHTAYEAWNRDDCDAWLELLDPDVEIRTSGVFPDLAPDYPGHARARKFWRQLHEPWGVFRIEVEHAAGRPSAGPKTYWRAGGISWFAWMTSSGSYSALTSRRRR